MFAFVLLSIVASAVASNVYVNAPCPDVKPVDNFNLKAWATGRWYEAFRYPNTYENEITCNLSEYVPTDDNRYSIKSYGISKGKVRAIEGSAQLAEDAGKTGKLLYSYGAGDAITKSTFWVLGTDYDNYAVVYSCKYDEEKKSRQDFAWVFSRSMKLEGEPKAAADKIVKDYAFLDASKLIQTDFSDAGCKEEL